MSLPIPLRDVFCFTPPEGEFFSSFSVSPSPNYCFCVSTEDYSVLISEYHTSTTVHKQPVVIQPPTDQTVPTTNTHVVSPLSIAATTQPIVVQPVVDHTLKHVLPVPPKVPVTLPECSRHNKLDRLINKRRITVRDLSTSKFLPINVDFVQTADNELAADTEAYDQYIRNSASAVQHIVPRGLHKLDEIFDVFNIKATTIIDLGAAPGYTSQLFRDRKMVVHGYEYPPQPISQKFRSNYKTITKFDITKKFTNFHDAEVLYCDVGPVNVHPPLS